MDYKDVSTFGVSPNVIGSPNGDSPNVLVVKNSPNVNSRLGYSPNRYEMENTPRDECIFLATSQFYRKTELAVKRSDTFLLYEWMIY